MKKIALILVLGFVLQSCSNNNNGTVELTSDLDSFSYCIGRDLAQSVKMNNKGLKAINLDAMAAGVKDALEEDSTRNFKDKDLNRIIINYLNGISKDAEAAFLERCKKEDGLSETSSGLLYKELSKGDGSKPTLTDTVVFHYEGKFLDGEVFDNTFDKGRPASFPVSGTIEGWEEAFQMMKKGSKWRFIIPSSLAFGEKGNAQMIPPNSPLEFEIELLDIK